MRPTVMVVFDAVARRDHRRHAGAPAARRLGAGGLRERARAPRRRSSTASTRPLPIEPSGSTAHALRAAPVSNTTRGRLPRHGRAGEGVHPRRRHLPGRALAALHGAVSRCRAFALYRALRRVNPAPFLCYLDFDGFQIVCSRPEILVRVRDGKVTIRPIAGTRPRGATPAEDARLTPTACSPIRRSAPST